MFYGMFVQIEEQLINFVGIFVCGVIDEKNEVYKCVIEVEEGKDDDEDEDVENNQFVWLILRIYFICIGIVMIFVVFMQVLGILKVNFYLVFYFFKVFFVQMEFYVDQIVVFLVMVVGW